jgi:glycosyltransferase involved in cell wall biosynthesis
MLEAMKEGIPVLASDIPPHKQLIESDKGFLFQAGNCDSFVEAMQQALEQPTMREERARKAQNHVLTYYNWEKITSENLEVYQRLVLGSSMSNTI